jgi:hypothetical protein
MREARGNEGFAPKSLAVFDRPRQHRLEHLEGHVAPDDVIARQPDLSHAAAAELAHNLVTLAKAARRTLGRHAVGNRRSWHANRDRGQTVSGASSTTRPSNKWIVRVASCA